MTWQFPLNQYTNIVIGTWGTNFSENENPNIPKTFENDKPPLVNLLYSLLLFIYSFSAHSDLPGKTDAQITG